MLLGKSTDRNIPWMQLVIEAALVVFSVLLALGVKSCRDAQVQEELAQQALHNLEREILANKSEIENVYKYHKNLLDTLRSGNPPTGIDIKSPNIQNNAWEAAQSTGAISYIDFSIIEIASQIEEAQSRYQDFLKSSIEIALNYNFQSDLNPKRISQGLESMITGVVNSETHLLKLYDEAQRRLDTKNISEANDSSESQDS